MDAAVAFYRDVLGLPLVRREATDGRSSTPGRCDSPCTDGGCDAGGSTPCRGAAPSSSASTTSTRRASSCGPRRDVRRARRRGRGVRALRDGARPRRQPRAADRVRGMTAAEPDERAGDPTPGTRAGDAEACRRCGQPLPPGANFCPNCGAPVSVPVASERRVVTVVFADLAGSTELAAMLDPERFRDVLAAFHGMVTDEITALGGRAEGFIGDAVLGVFGVPVLHADDAERGVRAGLAIAERAGRIGARLELPVPVGVRVGVNTGPVAVGTADRPQHRDRRRGEHRGPAAAGGAARGGTRRRADPAARRRFGRVRGTPADRGQGVRRVDCRLARRRASSVRRPAGRSRSWIAAASSRCSPIRSSGSGCVSARTS